MNARQRKLTELLRLRRRLHDVPLGRLVRARIRALRKMTPGRSPSTPR